MTFLRTVSRTLVVFLIAAGTRLPAQTPATGASSGAEGVTVRHVIARRTADGRDVLAVSYKVNFPSRDSVDISELGVVSGVGEYAYLTSRSAVEVRDPKSGDQIARVELLVTDQTMGTEEVELPGKSAYPAAYREVSWAGKQSPSVNTMEVLSSYFVTGYELAEANKIQYFRTTFRELPGMPRNLRCRVSVMVSHLHQVPGTSGQTVRLHAYPREKPRADDEGAPSRAECVNAVAAFSSELLRRLSGTPQ